MLRISLLLNLVLLIVVKSQSTMNPWDLESMSKFIKEIGKAESDFIDSFNDQNIRDAITDTLGRMRGANEKIQNLTKLIAPIKYLYPVLNQLRPTVEFESQLVTTLETMDECIVYIKELYDIYIELSSKEEINENILNHWINVSTSDSSNYLLHRLTKLFSVMMGPLKTKGTSLFHDIGDKLPIMKPKDKCGFNLSIQQRIGYICSVILLFYLKGYVMTMHAYTLKTIHTMDIDKSVYYEREAEVSMRIIQCMFAAESAMKLNNITKVMTCDAKVKTPETYTSFRGLFSSVLVSLADTNPTRKCSHYCKDVKNVKPESCIGEGAYCPVRPCLGTINSCWTIDSSTICELPGESNRRYEWFQNNYDGKYYGHATDCMREGSKAILRTAELTTGSDDRTCNVCVCQCTETDKSSRAVRSVSLIPQMADIEENKVVSGVRIYEANRIIQIQIKQGKLLKRGFIDSSTNEWKKRDQLRYDNETLVGGAFKMYDEANNNWRQLNQSEYIILDYQDKYINIDDIVLEEGYVMTGVRWNFSRNSDNNNAKSLQIEIHATRYYYNGRLDTTDSKWVTPQNMEIHPEEFYGRKRKYVEIKEPDDSIKAPYNHPTVPPNSLMSFQLTDDIKDAGQHTIPYFDSQPVETFPAIAMNGMAIHYRGKTGFGGFIVLSLNAVDLSESWNIYMDYNDLRGYMKNYSGPRIYG